MPKTILILNRLIIFIVAITLILSTILFIEIEKENTELMEMSSVSHSIEKRNVAMSALIIYSTTYVGISNNMITNVFSLPLLNTIINRLDGLVMLLSTFAKDVQDSHVLIS